MRASNLLPWLLFVSATIVAFVLYFGSPKSPIQLSTVVTNGVTHIFTNTAERVEIPAVYVEALSRWEKSINAKSAVREEVLFKMKDVAVKVFIAKELSEYMSEDEAQTKFELVLRRNNVPVSKTASSFLMYTCNAIIHKSTSQLVYSTSCELWELHPLFRGGEWRSMACTIWQATQSVGYAGTLKIKETMQADIETNAEQFANAYLSANPKEQK